MGVLHGGDQPKSSDKLGSEKHRHMVEGHQQRKRFPKTHFDITALIFYFLFFEGGESGMFFSKVMRWSIIHLGSLKSCFV